MKLFFLGFLMCIAPFSSYAVSGVGVRTVYSDNNVDTSTWRVLVAQSPLTSSSIAVADTSGQTMEVGICPYNATANTEIRQFLIPPGGIEVKIQVPSNYRVSIRAVSGTATVGENDLNVLY